MSFTPNKTLNNSATNNFEKAKVIAYSNVYVAGLKGGRKKVGAVKMYENNQLAQFLADHQEAIGDKLTIEVDMVFVETAELAFDEAELAVA